MKMVKSLLLSSAAGLVVVTAGQAADLPVKAQPVQYVKVCSLYGAGFYYMPGTDMCLKIGGWTRAEITEGGNGNITWGPFNGNANTRATSNVVMRARGYITADAREQTGYGVARGYIAAGIATNDVGLQATSLVDSVNRAYVQWAGFTTGLAQSFYDFYSVPSAQYRGGYLPASDTGDGGWWVWAYTAQFGGGMSATLSAEARRMTQICNANANPTSAAAGAIPNNSNCSYTPGSFYNGSPVALTDPAGTQTLGAGITSLFPGAGSYGGQQWPDVILNVRIDQAWGAAQLMGALHDVNATYYSTAPGGSATIASLSNPPDKVGFAVGAGLKLLAPSIAPGDYFQSQVNYTQGALRYIFNTPNTNWGKVDGNQEAFGVLTDCTYYAGVGGATASGCQLTTAWGFNASFEHYYTPNWHESFYGAYAAVSYNSIANGAICSNFGGANAGGIVGGAYTAGAGCNNNWQTWGAGTRLQWDVTKSFYIGVEALYEVMQSGTLATAALPGMLAVTSSGATTTEASSSAWTFTLRMHKDFLP